MPLYFLKPCYFVASPLFSSLFCSFLSLLSGSPVDILFCPHLEQTPISPEFWGGQKVIMHLELLYNLA
jgi:hypothetical protein